MSNPAWAAGRDRMNRDMRECVRLGLLVGMPGRIGRGETRLSRARAEVAWMKQQDQELRELRERGDLEALATETNAEAWQRLHDLSLGFFDKVLSQDIEFNIENVQLLRVQNDTAQKVITISQKVAIERFRAQNIGALARVIERMRLRGKEPETIDHEPQTIGFDT